MAIKPETSNAILTAIVVAMILLALIGVGLTTADAALAYRYWVILVPIYGLLSVVGACFLEQDGPKWRMIARQVVHWAGVTAAVALDFSLSEPAGDSQNVAGLSALLLLALGSFLAGLYFDRRFMVVGLLLGLAAVILAKLNEYTWLIFAGGAVTVAGLVAYHWLWPRRPTTTGPMP